VCVVSWKKLAFFDRIHFYIPGWEMPSGLALILTMF